MPTYEYRSTAEPGCSFCADGFEVVRKISDPELTACPECGKPVTQVLSAAGISRSGPGLDRENIEKHGFTQYRKSGKGVYEKTAGKGPDMISADADLKT